MFKSPVYRSILFCALFIVLAVPVLAQGELSEIYNAPDGSYSFRYPEGWEYTESDDFVTLTSEVVDGKYVIVQVFSPEYVALFSDESADPLVALEELQTFFDQINGETEIVPFGDRDVAVAEITNETQDGVAMIVSLSGGGFGMIQAFSPPGDFEDYIETVVAILLTFDAADAGSGATDTKGETGLPSDSPETIEDYDGEWEDVVAGLEAQGVIASGGSLVFQEDTTFFEGRGNFFTPLASNQPFADVIMAGELSFNESDPTQLETCSLLARIGDDANGDAVTFIDVGFATGGDLFVQDKFSATDDSTIETETLSLDLDESHHLLFIALGDTLDVYVDGELVMDDALVGDRSGTFGIALRGADRGARCEGSNVWVYQASVFTPGLCEIAPSDNVNMRSGPGTSFDRAGQLAAGTIVVAEGVATDNDGFLWWLLDNGNWVREDVVRAQGDCASLPEE